MIKRFRHGFTLLEVMLSMAVLAVLAAVGFPIFQSLQVRNDLDIAVQTVVQSGRRAQMLSVASDGDATWGIRIQTGSTVVFKGPSYAARDISSDEISDLSGSIVPSGLTEIVYSKLNGFPGATGTLTLTGSNNETRSITINSKGVASF
jgi:prepilin-type N-terminal cleavage/methylation domain-containing protein